MPVEAMPSTRDFWNTRKIMVAGTMDKVDIARVEPVSYTHLLNTLEKYALSAYPTRSDIS